MPVLVKKPKREEREYIMTPEEERLYQESFEQERKGQFITSAELRKKLGL